MFPLALWAAVDEGLESSGCRWGGSHGRVLRLTSIRKLDSLRWLRRDVEKQPVMEEGTEGNGTLVAKSSSRHPRAAGSLFMESTSSLVAGEVSLPV